jgi:hypothetical protein
VTNAQAATITTAASTFLSALTANGFSATDTKVEVLSQEAPTPATNPLRTGQGGRVRIHPAYPNRAGAPGVHGFAWAVIPRPG